MSFFHNYLGEFGGEKRGTRRDRWQPPHRHLTLGSLQPKQINVHCDASSVSVDSAIILTRTERCRHTDTLRALSLSARYHAFSSPVPFGPSSPQSPEFKGQVISSNSNHTLDISVSQQCRRARLTSICLTVHAHMLT